jgi:hypothetical protein
MIEFLRKFLHLGVDGDDPAPADPPTTDDTLDDLIEAVEPTVTQKGDSEDPATRIAEAERRAAEAERRAADIEARARQSVQIPQGPKTDPESEREEAEFEQARKGGADENTLRWLRWQIDSNRKWRQTSQRADATFAAASDRADRAEFAALEYTKPKVFKAYGARVEEALDGFRRAGQNMPPRKMILTYLIGQDILDGKVKPKKAVASPSAEPAKVDRGSLPNARSDVRKGAAPQTEREKRRARLEGQPL